MLNIFLFIAYFFLFYYSFKKSEIGVGLLIFLNCTLDMSSLDMALPGIGTLAASDFVVFGLITHYFKYKNYQQSYFKFSIYSIVFLVLSGALYFYAIDYVDIKFIYNSLFRYSLMFFVYLIVLSFDESQRTIVFKFMYVSVAVVLCAQLYAYASLDVEFIKFFYYQFRETGVFDLIGWGPDQEILFQIANMGYPRLYPAGTALCLTLFSFIFSRFFIGEFKDKFYLCLNVTFLVLLSAFMVSLRGRAPLISFALIFIYLFLLPFFVKERAYSFFNSKISFKYLSIVALLLLILPLAILFSDSTLISSFIDRIAAFNIDFYFDSDRSNRASDSLMAIDILSHNPIFGIGSPSIPLDSQGLHRAGFDVHPVLSLGLYRGVPVMLIVFINILIFFRKIANLSVDNLSRYALPYGVALTNLLLLAFLNSIQVFSDPMNLIPFLVFLALFDRACLVRQGDMLSL